MIRLKLVVPNFHPEFDALQVLLNKFDKSNGLVLTAKEPGDIQYEMKVLEKHLSSPNTCHGGAISGMMDAVIGSTALSMAFTEGNLVSTVEFKINYFKPVFEGETLIGTGVIEFTGKSLIYKESLNIFFQEKKIIIKTFRNRRD